MWLIQKGLSMALGIFFLSISILMPIYYILVLEQETSIQTSAYLINHQQEAEKLTIKIPFSLSYNNDWEESVASDGLFEYEGQFYTVISKDFKSDTLYFNCIKNNNAREIFSALSEKMQAFTDSDAQNEAPSKSSSKIIKLLNLNYYLSANSTFHFDTSFTDESSKVFIHHILFYTSPYLSQNTPPPDAKVWS